MKETYIEKGEEVISLEEVKNYLKIDFDEQDSFLLDLISTVREFAEKTLKSHIIRKTVSQVNVAENLHVIRLMQWPLLQINSVFVIDNNRKKIKLSEDDYHVNDFNYLHISDLGFLYNKVIVSYDVGYQDSSFLPKSLKTAMLLHISSIYDKGCEAKDIPQFANDIYNLLRKLRI